MSVLVVYFTWLTLQTPRESGEQKEDFADRKAQMHTEFEEMRFPNDKDIFDDTPPIGANDEDAVMVPLTATNNNNNEDLMMPKCENVSCFWITR